MDGGDMEAPQKRKGRRRGCALVALFVPLVLVGAFVGWRVYMRSRVRAELGAIRQAGYPVTLQELDAWYEWPEGENAADVYLQAFDQYAEPAEEDHEFLPLLGEAELPPRGEPLPKEMKEAIRRHLAANRTALELLHEAAEIEGCRYPIDLTEAFVLPMRPTGPLRRSSLLLALEALLHADDGNPEGATQSLRSSLALATSLRHEPVYISRLVNIACNAIAVDGLERTLTRTELRGADLVALASELQEAQAPEALARGLAGERCIVSSVFELSGEELHGIRVFIHPVPVVLFKGIGLMDVNQFAYLKLMGEAVAVAEQPFPERVDAIASLRTEERVGELPGYCRITKMLLPALERAAEVDAEGAARLHAALLGVAVERYRLARGRLPETLDQLVPDYLEAVLQDPFDGKPLRYKKLQKGYVVYSVGPDLSDDGGKEREDGEGPGHDVTFTVER